MTVRKGDIVRSRLMKQTAGNGFVHYILPDNMACVEFAIWGKTFIPVSELEKVQD